MSTLSPAVRDLARRLVAYEAARAGALEGRAEPAARVLDELRIRLSTLMGVIGFSTLLFRALALAKAEAPSLESVQVRTDGTLEHFDPAGQIEASDPRASGGIVLIAHLLQLLVTFIGNPLTLQLLRDAFPDAVPDEIDLRNEEKP